ncbi:MAG TPA: TraR/DksA family transcriptional regulator [Candidatus Binatia bacterium]|nr:TraR/DksA family transcriptional regulator [Candidatus Binatia bacterium]
MRKRDRDKFQGKLLEMRKEIMRVIKDDMKEGREGEAGEGRDTYDIASDERDREINLLLGDRERKKLQLIDDALARIDTGEYGDCDECGGEIAAGRLEAMPFTRLCVTCQDEYEQAQRTMHSDAGGMSAPRLPGADAEDDTY